MCFVLDNYTKCGILELTKLTDGKLIFYMSINNVGWPKFDRDTLCFCTSS